MLLSWLQNIFPIAGYFCRQQRYITWPPILEIVQLSIWFVFDNIMQNIDNDLFCRVAIKIDMNNAITSPVPDLRDILKTALLFG